MDKLITIIGPTASGKSALAVRLARKFNGEVISADSRQVYRGLNIGSGKITKREMAGIPHHLISITNPKKTFSAAAYARLAKRALKEVYRRGHLPIICGGTGFYLDTLLGSVNIPPVPPNLSLRKKLARLTTIQLFTRLKKLDHERAKNIDAKNPRRLIRAIEIAEAQTSSKLKPKPNTPPISVTLLKLGLKPPRIKLRKEIDKRVEKRLKRGLLAEVKKLRQGGLTWRRLTELGLDYRLASYYLQSKLDKVELVEKLKTENWRYAKRQLTWFKRDQAIKWIASSREAERLTRDFLKK